MDTPTYRLARAVHEAAHLPDAAPPSAVARVFGLPEALVVDALERGALVGRLFPECGWRVSKRAALAWIEGRRLEEVADDHS